MSSPEPPAQLSFEEAVAELEDIVSNMERGELPLETALALFERGVKLVNHSQLTLKQAEQKVQMLIDNDTSSALVDIATSDATGNGSAD